MPSVIIQPEEKYLSRLLTLRLYGATETISTSKEVDELMFYYLITKAFGLIDCNKKAKSNFQNTLKYAVVTEELLNSRSPDASPPVCQTSPVCETFLS